MQVTVKGKQMDVGDALRTHITTSLTDAVNKYFARPLDATVVLSPDAHLVRVDITVHVARNLTVQAKASATDAHRAADEAIEHAEKRIRRYKRRLKEDHHRGVMPHDIESATSYVLAPEAEEETAPLSTQPMIVAELQVSIETLAVPDAVMRLDLGDLPVLMFRHVTHGGLNVIYRRADGHIGWIDPQGNSQTVNPSGIPVTRGEPKGVLSAAQ